MDASVPPPRPPAVPALLMRLGDAAARLLGLLPALLLAFLWLRAAEFAAAWPYGSSAADAAWCVSRALADDALMFLRYLVPLWLLCLPLLLARSRRLRVGGIGATWTVLVLAQACLVQYFVTAKVPLGADLYTYTLRDIGETTAAGATLNPFVAAGTVLAVATLWWVLVRRTREDEARLAARGTIVALLIGLAALTYAPRELPAARAETEYARSLRLSKLASFVDSSVGYWAGAAVPGALAGGKAPGSASTTAATAYGRTDPAYPFLHDEHTPDVLGPHFNAGPAPPNLVFVIVEGLGRSFSGPGASLGSFTPFLDELAGRSLYFENFLATQGRTFGVLPSLFGSLPFGAQGFAALDTRMPEHATLLSILKTQGYRLRFFTGTDARFDSERTFLERQGVDTIVDRQGFGSGYARTNEWGFDDAELVSRTLAEEARDAHPPYVDVIQTITMHDPYRFLGQDKFLKQVDERLAKIGIAEAQRGAYRAYQHIYASILYTDDALRRYFEGAARRPDYANTIFIVTGDHRLPEIPIAEWIDRYHVPLLIYSPLLKSPQRIKAVSSDFDVAPSLLAMLSHGYGLRTPARVTWVGDGLDLEPTFRSVHDIPLKQTKANLVDFVAGGWFVSRGALYLLRDGMHAEPVDDAAALDRAQRRFATFRAANGEFARTLRLMPPGSADRTIAYVAAERRALPAPTEPTTAAALAVRDVRAPEHARGTELAIDVEFTNAAAEPTEVFVPLVVLLGYDGREISETYGPSQALPAGQAVTVHLPLKAAGIPPGRYFLSVYPSDPTTGKRSGDGRFRIPVVIDG